MLSGTEPRIILNPGNFTLPDVRTYRIRGFLIAEGESIITYLYTHRQFIAKE